MCKLYWDLIKFTTVISKHIALENENTILQLTIEKVHPKCISYHGWKIFQSIIECMVSISASQIVTTRLTKAWPWISKLGGAVSSITSYLVFNTSAASKICRRCFSVEILTRTYRYESQLILQFYIISNYKTTTLT